ncbi:hypothetical protein BDN72DRAFT_963923 [Pluteus cervinus]|uniref:Uncharacterized protein n=1 Tax=Pluteus cervinus TaxID=181527 RepID=A0ACD3AC30_9AGAR|nr:hypothetical protein BDN72DRAFT_963923 [Pluteus cervinus]
MSINNSFGAMFIGGLATMMIWVMTCTQAYTYFTRKSPDGLAFKAMFAFLCVLDTFDSVLIVHFIYFYIITQYGNSLALSLDTRSLDVHNTIEPISDFIIRMMFAHRVFIFSNKNIVLTTWITVFSLTGLVSGLIVTLGSYNGSIEEGIAVLILEPCVCNANRFQHHHFIVLPSIQVQDWLPECWRIGRPAGQCDDSPKQQPYSFLWVHLTLIIGCLLTPLQHIKAVAIILSKLYLNSYLASLNAREAIRDRFQTSEPISVNSQFFAGNIGPSLAVQARNP